MNPIVKDLLMVLIRAAFLAFFTWLATHHVITEDQQQKFIDFFTDPTVLVSVVGFVGTVYLIVRSRIWERRKLLTALSSPATSEEVIEIVAKTEAPAITTPKTSIPVPKEK